ncbi:MAG: radical SAM protein [Coriobacteriales bacterium]|nr:radical SAM protein [Coriobacteriales bacterium]
MSDWPQISSLALDPIEKKPLARFFPGSMILSVGFFGCSFRCPFCQNSSISQVRDDGRALSGEDGRDGRDGDAAHAAHDGRSAGAASPAHDERERKNTARLGISLTPEDLVAHALAARSDGNIGIAYTYSEPLVHLPYLRKAATLARAAGLKNVLVSNGFVSEAGARDIFALLDAANIDLKAFGSAGEGFYRWIGAPGGLEVVKRSIALAAATPNLHLEVTTLVIPGRNDSAADIGAEARWLASLNPEIPLHLSRFFPAWQMTQAKPTPRETIQKLVQVARRHLRFVYSGNMA